MDMSKQEAIWTLENGAWWDSLPDDISDAEKNPLLAAIDTAVAALRSEPNPLDNSKCAAEWLEYTGADKGFHYCSHCKQQAFNYEENREVIEVLSEFCPSCGFAMTPAALEKMKECLLNTKTDEGGKNQ